MVDREFEIFTEIYNVIHEAYPNLDMSSVYERVPSTFPHASIEEMDNAVYTRTYDNCPEEKFAAVTYEVNVYSNKTQGRKEEAKEIMNAIDRCMTRMNFTRSMCEPVPNLDDSTIYRITARYRAVYSNDYIYRR